jgi:Cell division protein CrgA
MLPDDAKAAPTPTDSVSPWLGATSLSIFTLGMIGMLVYTLADLDWQQQLGGWNYLAGTGMMLGSIVMLRWWHADTRFGRHP